MMFPYSKHCKKCGKEIFPTYEWAYKEGSKYYCSWKCFNHRHDGKEKREIVIPKVGDKIRIISMSGIPSYDGKEGIVKIIDSMGQLQGTWGSLVVVPSEDKIDIIGENDHDK